MAKSNNGKTYSEIKEDCKEDLGYTVFCANYGYDKNTDEALLAYQNHIRMYGV